MLPVTHGDEFTRLHVFLYTLVLFAATLLPFIYGMSGSIYLAPRSSWARCSRGYAWRLLAQLLRRAGAQDLPLLDRATWRCCSRRCCVDHYLGPLLA